MMAKKMDKHVEALRAQVEAHANAFGFSSKDLLVQLGAVALIEGLQQKSPKAIKIAGQICSHVPQGS
jgi:hypothetical protein